MQKNGKRILFFLTATLFGMGCGGESPSTDAGAKTSNVPASADGQSPAGDAAPGHAGRTLLVTQSNFAKDANGKYVVPDAGELLLLTPAENLWTVERITDTDSNVLHKAIQYDRDTLFTIGGNEARLKKWQKKGGKWNATTVWSPTFGGKQNRLRDFELADVNGDGVKELAIATHDQGVVAVAWNRNQKWEVQEIDRKPDTFVHEIEIGDLDKDGKKEIYATPSDPNTSTGVKQGGAVVQYAWNGSDFVRREVARYDSRHIKEVLVADVDGDGADELYAALEAEMGENFSIKTPVEIMRYDYRDGKFESRKVMSIADRFCRFLTAGDVDGDGKNELIASAFSAGVWVVEEANGTYSGTCIDKASGGFEHAAYLADMNGDNKLELYVADDNAGALRQYTFSGGAYQSKIIQKRLVPKSAMVWNITVADL